jgi:hypothetical protein
MTLAEGSRFSAEARPEHETTIAASIASAVVDEEKIQSTEDRVHSDSENDDDNQDALDAAWGKHGRVWMWIGYADCFKP